MELYARTDDSHGNAGRTIETGGSFAHVGIAGIAGQAEKGSSIGYSGGIVEETMTIRTFQHTPPPRTFSNFGDVTDYARKLYDAIFRLRQGKTENVGEITLTINSATSTLNRVGLSNQSVVVFDPRTASAASELYGGTMYVLTANRGTDTWTITHVNAATADRTFQYAVVG